MVSMCVCTFMSLCVNLTAPLNNEWLINDYRAQRASCCPVAYYRGATQPTHDIHIHTYTHTFSIMFSPQYLFHYLYYPYTCAFPTKACQNVFCGKVLLSKKRLTKDYYILCINLPSFYLQMKRIIAILT